MKAFVCCIALLLFSVAGCTQAKPPFYEQVYKATLSLVIPTTAAGQGGTCSGTAVAFNVILTAEHCLEPVSDLTATYNKIILADGELCEVREIIPDGNDHALVIVSACRFKHVARVSPPAMNLKPPRVGTQVFLWGNPYGLTDLLRFGRVAGYYAPDNNVMLTDMHAYPGDSGSGIFDAATGLLIGVTSIKVNAMEFMGAYPVRFTPAEWRRVGL